MSVWINLSLNVVLIGLVGAGLVQATRLIKHLSGLEQGRVEMERFVREFNGAVVRAEAGINNLRLTARESGNDLERMIDKATLMRDELHYIVESADKIAGRLSGDASAMRPAAAQAQPQQQQQTQSKQAANVTPIAHKKPPEQLSASAASRAERELMQALEKLG